MPNDVRALLSAIALVTAVNVVPALWSKAEGFGSLGVALAVFVGLTWYARYHQLGRNPFS